MRILRGRGARTILRLQGDDAVALDGYGARHVGERFCATQANFRGLPACHPLDEQLGADESHRADLPGNVDEEIHRAVIRRGIFSGHVYTLLRRVNLSISEAY